MEKARNVITQQKQIVPATDVQAQAALAALGSSEAATRQSFSFLNEHQLKVLIK